MVVTRILREFLLKSGIAINNATLAIFFLKRKPLMTLFRLKIDPKLLLNTNLNSKAFSMVISEISVGPAFKTTHYERHNASDDIICEYIKNYFKTKKIADIGVSDGASALYLIRKIAGIPNTTINLYDKYTHLILTRRWYGYIYSNQDHEVVYIRFLFLLLFAYPLKLTSSEDRASETLRFDNPIMKGFGLDINHFDIFKTRLETQVNFIKCANLLNPAYFSQEKIKSALRNLHSNLIEGGYLFIIHNTAQKESLLVLKKDGGNLILEKDINDSDLPRYIGITDRFAIN